MLTPSHTQHQISHSKLKITPQRRVHSTLSLKKQKQLIPVIKYQIE